jgi:hypothetical protein
LPVEDVLEVTLSDLTIIMTLRFGTLILSMCWWRGKYAFFNDWKCIRSSEFVDLEETEIHYFFIGIKDPILHLQTGQVYLA